MDTAQEEKLSMQECHYGNGADCNNLPQGVRRTVCIPCKARAAIADRHFYCSKCKETKPKPKGPGGTGYAVDDQDRKICYACCADQDKEWMDKEGRIVLYLTQGPDDKWTVGNWPGTLKFSVRYVRTGDHNIAGIRRDFQFRDHNRRLWYGTQYGNNSDIARCRRYKNQEVA